MICFHCGKCVWKHDLAVLRDLTAIRYFNYWQLELRSLYSLLCWYCVHYYICRHQQTTITANYIFSFLHNHHFQTVIKAVFLNISETARTSRVARTPLNKNSEESNQDQIGFLWRYNRVSSRPGHTRRSGLPNTYFISSLWTESGAPTAKISVPSAG